jgi:hypothetical protein
MLQGAPELTPGQLLDAGRRAEAEGKPDFAVQFYLHLAEHFGQTPDAAEARTAITRMVAAAQPRQVWQAGSVTDSKLRHRSGRTLAALFSGIGWVVMMVALTTGAAIIGLRYLPTPLPVPLPQPLELDTAMLMQLPFAVLGGAAMVVCGQLARALFDQADASRELLASERRRAGTGQS